MALNQDKNVKLYYSIKEVAKMFSINESTLRYWETEFPQLKPHTLPGTKVRQYSQSDIEQIRIIYNLVKVRGFKLAKAREMLRLNKDGVDKTADILNTLLSVKSQLVELKKHLDSLT